jgi:hypothetical protein
MLWCTEASVWRSNCSVVVTYKHASSTSLYTHLQLMGGEAESEEPGRYGAALSETPAPDISVPTMPYGAPPMPDTSIANATTGHWWVTDTSKVRLLSFHTIVSFKTYDPKCWKRERHSTEHNTTHILNRR